MRVMSCPRGCHVVVATRKWWSLIGSHLALPWLKLQWQVHSAFKRAIQRYSELVAARGGVTPPTDNQPLPLPAPPRSTAAAAGGVTGGLTPPGCSMDGGSCQGVQVPNLPSYVVPLLVGCV
jgi:hypothetical protein